MKNHPDVVFLVSLAVTAASAAKPKASKLLTECKKLLAKTTDQMLEAEPVLLNHGQAADGG